MKFTLVYEGQLKPAAKAKAVDKQNIREVFDAQLKILWTKGQMAEQRTISLGSPDDPTSTLKSVRQVNSCSYLPVISDKQGLLAKISITWLRYEPPGSILQAGDIDNRLKTLLDCLQTPPSGQVEGLSVEGTEEQPFCTVLDDDALISDINVNTVQDLRSSAERGAVLLLVTVKPVVVNFYPFGNGAFL